MCRFLLYLGPEVILSSVVIDPDHGMIQQASKAHDCITPLNADGFGVAWYVPSISPLPACFRDVSPAWSNQNLKQITRVSKSHCIFAHVRAASLGNVMQTNCHPFCFKNLTFMHNGTVPHYIHLKRRMLDTVSDAAFNLIQGTTDSEMMFAMFVTNFERITGELTTTLSSMEDPYSAIDHTQHLVEALRETLKQVHMFVLDYEYSTYVNYGTEKPSNRRGSIDQDGADLPYTQAIGRLNIAVTDGKSIVAARYVCSEPKTAHTLYYARGSKIEYKGKSCCVAKCDSSVKQPMVVVSSEPLGNSFVCEVVPVNHFVVAGPDDYFAVESCS